MNQRLLELALKKQRLQLKAATQRQQVAHHLQIWSPAFGAADRVGTAMRWAKSHPEWLVGAGVILLVARPRAVLRWARRGFFFWQSLRRIRGAMDSFLAAG
jgi:hypothetical protein